MAGQPEIEQTVIGYGLHGWDGAQHVLFAIWTLLKAHDIETPFPRRVLHNTGTATAA